jgi:hypothetical protein
MVIFQIFHPVILRVGHVDKLDDVWPTSSLAHIVKAQAMSRLHLGTRIYGEIEGKSRRVYCTTVHTLKVFVIDC